MKLFHTRERLVNHIRYRSLTCKSMFLLSPPPYSEVEAQHYKHMGGQLTTLSHNDNMEVSCRTAYICADTKALAKKSSITNLCLIIKSLMLGRLMC